MNSKIHDIQKCAFVGADRVCKSNQNTRNERHESIFVGLNDMHLHSKP